MPARKKSTQDTAPHQPTLFEKIGGQAIHISHEIASGTEHLLEAAGDKFSTLKENIVNKIGRTTTARKTTKKPAKKAAPKKAVKKAAVQVKKKVAAVKKKAVKKVSKAAKKAGKKATPKKLAKKIIRRRSN